MSDELTDTPELDNEVMRAEELMMLWPEVPIAMVVQLCQEWIQDGDDGHY